MKTKEKSPGPFNIAGAALLCCLIIEISKALAATPGGQLPTGAISIGEVQQIVDKTEDRLVQKIGSMETSLKTEVSGIDARLQELQKELAGAKKNTILGMIGVALFSGFFVGILTNVVQSRRDRRKARVDLKREIATQFNLFIPRLRELHETEREAFRAKNDERSRFVQRKNELLKDVEGPQSSLYALLQNVTHIFDSEDSHRLVDEFFRWYTEQMKADDQAQMGGKGPLVLDFGLDAEIYRWRDKILRTLEEEINTPKSHLLEWFRRKPKKGPARAVLIFAVTIAFAFSVDVRHVFATSHFTIRPPSLIIGIDRDVAGFDPRSTSTTERFVNSLIYETLVDLDDFGRIVSRLAASWSLDPDGRILTMKLRPGVTFHDGSALNADVVIANASAARRPLFQQVESARALSATDVEFRLRDIGAVSFLAALARPEAAMIGLRVIREDGRILSPTGTGPFRFKSYENGQFISLPTFDGYWGTKPRFNGVALIPVPDLPTALQLLTKDQLHIAMFLQPSPSLARMAAGRIATSPSIRTLWLHIDGSQVPSIEIRQAVAHAIDRSTLIEKTYLGWGDVATDGLFPSGWAGKPEEIVLPLNMARSKELLQKSGVAGIPFIVAAPEDFSGVASGVVQQLNAVGFKASVEVVPTFNQIAPLIRQRKASAWIGAMDFAYDLASIFGQIFIKGGALNWNDYSDPQVAKSISFAAKSAKIGDQYQQINDAQKALIRERAIVVPLLRPRNIYASSAKVRGFRLNRFGIPDLTKVELQ